MAEWGGQSMNRVSRVDYLFRIQAEHVFLDLSRLEQR